MHINSANMRQGFSLLELAVVVMVGGVVLFGAWQMSSYVGNGAKVQILTEQTKTVAYAANKYINVNHTALLTVLPSINSSGEILLSDIKAAGYLDSSFPTTNVAGQTYRVLVKREDAGSSGADVADTIVGVVVSYGGDTLSDSVGNLFLKSFGSGGGFIFSDSSTTARGPAGGWQINLSGTGWSSIASYTPSAGHVVVSLNMQFGTTFIAPTPMLDSLSDVRTNYAVESMFVGELSGSVAQNGVGNTSAGYNSLNALNAGEYNTALGRSSLAQVIDGSGNTALGYMSGQIITTGSDNLSIGSGINPPAAASETFLNIGNFLYGNLLTEQYRLGDSNFTTSISFDAGLSTNTIRPPVGTTAQRPTCNESTRAGMRYNTTNNTIDFCNAGPWNSTATPLATISPANTGFPGAGFLVLTQTRWDGNLGGFEGARQKCFTELTTNTNWKYYTDADSAGLLTLENITPFLCTSDYCPYVQISTNYYFAAVGDSSVGGGYFTASNQGYGPNNLYSWAGQNYFGRVDTYWTGRSCYYSHVYNFYPTASCPTQTYCNNWTSNSSAQTGTYAFSASADGGYGYQRWGALTNTCDKTYPLICLVGPNATPVLGAGTTTPVAHSEDYYFVLSETAWNGNLGGIDGANSKCLTELTTNTNWKYYTDANSRGLLTSQHVKALVCGNGLCQVLAPYTKYYYARVGDSTSGGSYFTSSVDGVGPNEATNNWSGATFFGVSADYWMGFWEPYGASAAFIVYGAEDNCTDWSSNSASVVGHTGTSNATGTLRWNNADDACSSTRRLICVVNP